VSAKATLVLSGVRSPGSAKGSIYSGPLPAPGTNSMSDKYFVDTNVLVYAHDRSTGSKHEIARTLIDRLWVSGGGVVSTQVLQELCVNLRRKAGHPMPADEVRRLIQDYSGWEVVVNSADSVLQALDIEGRYKTSFWDALILQAAEQSGAATLYSEDLASGQRYGSVRVINPFAESYR
jgi:predicted nucleic acid-binding protein